MRIMMVHIFPIAYPAYRAYHAHLGVAILAEAAPLFSVSAFVTGAAWVPWSMTAIAIF
jgi:hypothetical protein